MGWKNGCLFQCRQPRPTTTEDLFHRSPFSAVPAFSPRNPSIFSAKPGIYTYRMGFLPHYHFDTASLDFQGHTLTLCCATILPSLQPCPSADTTVTGRQEWTIFLLDTSIGSTTSPPTLPRRTLALWHDRYLEREGAATKLHAYTDTAKDSRRGIRSLPTLSRFIWEHTLGEGAPFPRDFDAAVKGTLLQYRRTEQQRSREGSCSTCTDLDEPMEDVAIDDADAGLRDHEADAVDRPGLPTNTLEPVSSRDFSPPLTTRLETSHDAGSSGDGSPSCSEPPTDDDASKSRGVDDQVKGACLSSYERRLDERQLARCFSIIPSKRRPRDPERTLNGLHYYFTHRLEGMQKVPTEYGTARALQRCLNRWQEDKSKNKEGETIWTRLERLFREFEANGSQPGRPTASPAADTATSSTHELPPEIREKIAPETFEALLAFVQSINKPTSS